MWFSLVPLSVLTVERSAVGFPSKPSDVNVALRRWLLIQPNLQGFLPRHEHQGLRHTLKRNGLRLYEIEYIDGVTDAQLKTCATTFS